MPRHSGTHPGADRHDQRFAELRRQLQDLGYFCKGTILEKKDEVRPAPLAPATRDPSKRHGPYWEWTYKVQGKPSM